MTANVCMVNRRFGLWPKTSEFGAFSGRSRE
jgi:hypothetical protein